MSAQETLKGKPLAYAQSPCCAVPLVLPNPDCDWHAYRGLTVDLARALDYSMANDALCERVLTMETGAMVRVLEFVRSTILAHAQQEAAGGDSALMVMDNLVDRYNRFIEEIRP